MFRAFAVVALLFVGATASVVAVTAQETWTPEPAPTGPEFAATPDAGDPHGDATADVPRLDSVLPNPVAEDDRGEHVVAVFPDRTDLGGWTIADDQGATALPNVSVKGRVVLTATPEAIPAGVRERTDRTVAVDGFPELANGGETVVLARDGTAVGRLAYEDAPTAERWVGARWVPRGATDFEPVTAGPGRVRAFVTPDSAVPLSAIADAETHVSLAGYTYTSGRVTEALVAAADRGASVRVLVDGGPVGGMTEREVAALDRLVDAGVSVRVVGGDAARYDFHHAKYVVADDRALVLTENWKPSGSGGHANRGWGVELTDGSVAVDALNRTFRADWRAHDAIPWPRYRARVSPVESTRAAGDYPSRVDPATVDVESVTVLVAPDNAETELVSLVAGANSSVRIEQMDAGGVDGPLVRATLAAARNGTRVRVLLSSAWYAEDANGRVVDRLNAVADRENLDLRARLVDPGGRFETLHAKGVVVDERHVVVGSVNWNRNSLRDNREVAVVVTGDEVGRYYAAAFDADWRGRGSSPGGDRLLGVAAVAAAALALLVLSRRVEFGTVEPEEPLR
ncbi:phospholipase D-like domain-containing protein [Haloarchaeobius sp. HRN-SO-5]|uniref:phospholipase D-like domain-containing protein n=1 Tax=Haloarchaeobius sp. HRN-SO-5 TaxID=3446118 RepID=UPI003EB73547